MNMQQSLLDAVVRQRDAALNAQARAEAERDMLRAETDRLAQALAAAQPANDARET